MIRADIPETYKVPLSGSSSNAVMATVPATKGPFAVQAPVSPSFMPGTPGYTRPASPWHLPPPPPSTPVSGAAPNHPFLQDYAMLVLNNINRLQQQQQDDHHLMPNYNTVQSVSPSPSQGNQYSGHGSSGMGSSLHSSALRLRSPHKPPGRSPRNSSPVNVNGNLTANLHKLDLTSGSSGIGGVSHSTEKEMSQDISVILSGINGMSVGDRRYVTDVIFIISIFFILIFKSSGL